MAELNTPDPFEDFIKKQSPDDDFEREALEGLNSLPLPELKQLKAGLDERISSIHPKKTAMNWLAVAASLLLVTSLSILTWYYLQPTEITVAVQTNASPAQSNENSALPKAALPVASDATLPDPTPSITPKPLRTSSQKNSVKSEINTNSTLPQAAPQREMADEEVASNVVEQRADSVMKEPVVEVVETKRAMAKRKLSTADEPELASVAMAAPVAAGMSPACVSTKELKSLNKKLVQLLKGTAKKTMWTVRIQVDAGGKLTVVRFMEPLEGELKKDIQDAISTITLKSDTQPCVFDFNFEPEKN